LPKEVYLVVADLAEEGVDWQGYLVRSTAVCPNYKTAYYVGISISGILKPRSSYRVSLEKLKADGAVKVEGEDQKSFTIVRTKFIKYF
jgi:hypothetical protein